MPTLTHLLPLKGKTLATMKEDEDGVAMQGFRKAKAQLIPDWEPYSICLGSADTLHLPPSIRPARVPSIAGFSVGQRALSWLSVTVQLKISILGFFTEADKSLCFCDPRL